MAIQILFSLLAIAGLYYLNSKLNSFTKASFADENMALTAMRQDFPDNDNDKISQTLYWDKNIALFEYQQKATPTHELNKPMVGISMAIGDNFVCRQLPMSLFTKSLDSLSVTSNNCSITIDPHDITLSPITINFTDKDPLYYWLLERKVVNHSNNNKINEQTMLGEI